MNLDFFMIYSLFPSKVCLEHIQNVFVLCRRVYKRFIESEHKFSTFNNKLFLSFL